MNRVEELKEALAFAEQQANAVQAALKEKGRFAKFYVAHYQSLGAKRTGSFLGLVCKACNRWDAAGHANDCSTGELEKPSE